MDAGYAGNRHRFIGTDVLVCKDAGNESMGKSMQLLGSAAILYLSVPLFAALLELLQKILGEL